VFRFVFVCNVFGVEFQRYRGGGGVGGGRAVEEEEEGGPESLRMERTEKEHTFI
jgi:hypothetical protein